MIYRTIAVSFALAAVLDGGAEPYATVYTPEGELFAEVATGRDGYIVAFSNGEQRQFPRVPEWITGHDRHGHAFTSVVAHAMFECARAAKAALNA